MTLLEQKLYLNTHKAYLEAHIKDIRRDPIDVNRRAHDMARNAVYRFKEYWGGKNENYI